MAARAQLPAFPGAEGASAPTGYVHSIETSTPGRVELRALTPFIQWQLADFGSLTYPLALATTNLDGDGFANLLEIVTGGNATNADALARLSATMSNGSVRLHFTRNTNSADATIIVEGANSASNNAAWAGLVTNLAGSCGGATNVAESGTNSPVSVSVSDNANAMTNRIMRLRVTRP